MQSVGIIGAGQMGRGIAQVCLQSGFRVVIYDQNLQALKEVRSLLEKPLSKFCDKNSRNLKEVLDFLEDGTQSLETFPQCDLIIEAVTENIKVKSEIFASLPKYSNTIFASNTSSISIAELSAFSAIPEKFIGIHFMNPVPYMQLVEIIRHEKTSGETSSRVENFVKTLGKTYIHSADRAGFVVNRILLPMINEAIRALGENVATAHDIDVGMRLGANQPMGPLELADLIGLDTCLAILNVLYGEFKNDHYKPCPLLAEYVQKGLLGRKTKRGFYSYED
jgi:3-hydroxybutyryl-CoA dehydrogenase